MTNMIQNTMSGTNFRFVLHKQNTKTFNWMIQDTKLPDINITTARATSSPKVATHEIAGTGIGFERLTVRFLMDENIEAWQEIYVWIKELVEGYGPQPTNLYNEAESTASIHLTSNQHATLGKVFTFNRLYPVRLGGIELSTTPTDPFVLTCEVTFAYDTYDLEIDAAKKI